MAVRAFIVLTLYGLYRTLFPEKTYPEEARLEHWTALQTTFSPLPACTPDLQQCASLLQHGYPVRLARYAVIPWIMWLRFFNNLVTRGCTLKLPLFFKEVKELSFALAKSTGNQAIQSLDFSVTHISDDWAAGSATHSGGDVTVGYEQFGRLMKLLPFNQFIGPQERDDELGDSFEPNAELVMGELRGFRLRKAFALMRDFIAKGSLSTREWQKLDLVLSLLATVPHVNGTPASLIPSAWIRRNGRYIICQSC